MTPNWGRMDRYVRLYWRYQKGVCAVVRAVAHAVAYAVAYAVACKMLCMQLLCDVAWCGVV